MNVFERILRMGKAEKPEFWERYTKKFFCEQHKNMLLEEVRFVVIDTETTGLDSKSNALLSIAAIEVLGNEIRVPSVLEYFIEGKEGAEAVRVNPRDVKSVELHGILPHNRLAKVSEREALIRFIDFCGNSVLVAHHAWFDLTVLNRSLKQIAGGTLKNKILDTASLAEKIEKWEHYPLTKFDVSLDHLCQKYKIPMHDRHTSAGDVYLTALLFLKLTAILKRKGIHTLGALLRY